MAEQLIDVLKTQHLTFINGEFIGTKLVYREAPPSNDGEIYPSKDPGLFLGYVFSAPSLPRWMSSEFAAALQEHVTSSDQGPNLDLYSHDWIERIRFIPLASVANDESKQQAVNWDASTYALTNSLDHALSTGCSTLTARTKVRSVFLQDGGVTEITPFVQNDSAGRPQDVFYAIVSAVDKTDPASATEITIAPLSKRVNFVKSKMHQVQLSNCYALRHPQVSTTNITKLRSDAMNAVKAFQGSA